MIRVRPISLEALDAAFLDPFVQQLGRLPINQLPKMAPILAEGAPLAAYEFVAGGQPVGFVIVRINRRIMADVSFGPVVLDRDYYVPCVNALRRALRLKGLVLVRILPPYDVPRPEGAGARFNWATSVVDLSGTEEELLKSFSPNHRQSIRKAAAAAIRAEALAAGDAAAYAAGHVAMFARRGIPKDLAGTTQLVRDFQALEAASGGREAFVLAASPEGGQGIAGGGIFLVSGDTCNYYHGYAARLQPPLPVLHLLLWEAMKRAKALGCTRFDLTGYALDEGDGQLKAVNDFKRWFRGGILVYPPTVIIPLYGLLKPVLRLIRHRM